ncbi:MAG: type I phosphomannose isomerase catalytic subunit [Bacteroidales bacterium]
MNILYPFKFKPVYQKKLWGGSKIRQQLNHREAPAMQCGEAWVLSGVPGNESLVINGELKGNNLNELVEIFMGELVGDKLFTEYGEIFPVLIKFIDANSWLSIQVHPDDKLAEKRHGSFGKTEMWYILQAEEGSQLISGFNRKVERQEYLKSVEEGRLKDLLNFEQVKQGDVFYIPAGRVHALGPGILLTEIQQTSDITYRIYDWDRLDASGLPRELHTEQAIEAIDFSVKENYKTSYTIKKNASSNLVSSEKFSANLVLLDQGMKKDYSELDSFVAYVCIEGNMQIIAGNKTPLTLSKGETLLIPNAINHIEIYPQATVKFLEVFVP